MRAKGLVLNKFCYAALIEATGNQRPHPGRDSTGRAVSVRAFFVPILVLTWCRHRRQRVCRRDPLLLG
jgi:hypothetical protein